MRPSRTGPRLKSARRRRDVRSKGGSASRGSPSPPRSPTRFWPQHSPFTCGPAALGNVLQQIARLRPPDVTAEEIQIWRESTALVCPGSHPLGLALAAVRRGSSAVVQISGPRPWLWRHILSEHAGPEAMRIYRAAEQRLRQECMAQGIRVRSYREGPSRAGSSAGLLLVDARSVGAPHSDPHWVGLVSRGRDLQVFDPLRRSPYRSGRSLDDWKKRAGFQGSKVWIALLPLRG